MFSITVILSTDSVSEADRGQDDFLGFHILEKGVDVEGFDVGTPVSPLFVSCGVIFVHGAICYGRPSIS